MACTGVLPVIFFLCQSRACGLIQDVITIVLQLYGLPETRFGFLYLTLHPQDIPSHSKVVPPFWAMQRLLAEGHTASRCAFPSSVKVAAWCGIDIPLTTFRTQVKALSWLFRGPHPRAALNGTRCWAAQVYCPCEVQPQPCFPSQLKLDGLARADA